MSDPIRATLITVGAPNVTNNNVTKTVRLTINLVESNESKYPELNYKELVIAEERKKRSENGKTKGLDPFSDNDDDVERVARKFEQKYGGKSTYGRKGRKKRDDFADIGAGYDENDSFIDNADGYDEMFPPEIDTYYGGYYINSGLLEFKSVPESQPAPDGDPHRRNKRRLSSSSSEESSDSSSQSSPDEKERPVANGDVHSHNTEHRKKKNKNIDKKAKKVRRTDSSAATSGKQTSDDNAHGESADSRTSHSDSLASKPRSDTAPTSDSERDVEAKLDVKLPPAVTKVLEELEVLSGLLVHLEPAEVETKTDPYILKLDRAVSGAGAGAGWPRAAWSRAARALRAPRAALLQRAQHLKEHATTQTAPSSAQVLPAPSNKRKAEEVLEAEDTTQLSPELREEKIVEALSKLKQLIEERRPGMMANYSAECERVQEERKKLSLANSGGAGGAGGAERRLPKRRFPWCARARALLARLRVLATSPDHARDLLARRALPLFPAGFVRMPTLLRQADLKDFKGSDTKRHRGANSTVVSAPHFTEPIQFPSSLTVTTSLKNEDKADTEDKDKYKNTMFGNILSSFALNKELVVEKSEEKSKEDVYVPPNNIGSITITPVVNQTKNDKKNNAVDKQKEPLIKVKSPAALNEMVNNPTFIATQSKKDKDKQKKAEKSHKEKRIDTPLHIDTSCQTNKKDPSPKSKAEEISQKQIEHMRVNENNIPRPALVPVHHSPTFAKPDKRAPEVKKKKDVVIVSDVDPLGDIQQEPVVAVDDSSSDVEVIEDGRSEPKRDKSDSLSDDKVVNKIGDKKSVRDSKSDRKCEDDNEIASVLKNLRDLENSQDTTKFNNYSGGVITSAKHGKSSKHSSISRGGLFEEPRSEKDKLTNIFEQHGWM